MRRGYILANPKIHVKSSVQKQGVDERKRNVFPSFEEWQRQRREARGSVPGTERVPDVEGRVKGTSRTRVQEHLRLFTEEKALPGASEFAVHDFFCFMVCNGFCAAWQACLGLDTENKVIDDNTITRKK